MPPLNQYLKRAEISLDLLVSMFTIGFNGEAFHVLNGIPVDAVLQSAYVHENKLVLILEHPDFPVVESGTIVPGIRVKIGKAPAPVEELSDEELLVPGSKTLAASAKDELAEQAVETLKSKK
jgi:hypothetical protein